MFITFSFLIRLAHLLSHQIQNKFACALRMINLIAVVCCIPLHYFLVRSKFSVYVATVGNMNGLTPGTIEVSFKGTKNEVLMNTHANCTRLLLLSLLQIYMHLSPLQCHTCHHTVLRLCFNKTILLLNNLFL